jgi:hypothetical protein
MTKRTRRVRQASVLVLALMLAVLTLRNQMPVSAQVATEAMVGQPITLYLPLVQERSGWVSPFGYELWSSNDIRHPIVKSQARALDASWTRINTVSWRDVQPTENGPLNWSALANFEQQLLVANELDLTPIVVVDDYPQWAVIPDTREGVSYSSCAPLREEHFGSFANFMQALVARYKVAPYNVHHWELGNEPDVDPVRVPPHSVFGCWGDGGDKEYYGGDHYGNMLKVVSPVIRAANPQAKILIGSLLLERPTSTPEQDQPEDFLRGVLSVGAAPHFDILGYHAYSTSALYVSDTDLSGPSGSNPWTEWGGITVGKARYLRALMTEFGVSKPLFLTEAGFRCPPSYPRCLNPGPNFTQEFLEPQADHLVRTYVRALAEGVEQITWFTLNGPGWEESGLLNSSQAARPAFVAYRHLIQQSQRGETRPARVDNYGAEIEAYRFPRPGRPVDVLWSRSFSVVQVGLPESQFIEAFDRNGGRITPQVVDGQARFNVGSSPIYIHRKP